jgi:hypothetical protein
MNELNIRSSQLDPWMNDYQLDPKWKPLPTIEQVDGVNSVANQLISSGRQFKEQMRRVQEEEAFRRNGRVKIDPPKKLNTDLIDF